MKNPNSALLNWVHNLASSQPFAKAADCIVTTLVYSSWPIRNGEHPTTEHNVPVASIDELAKTKLIQRANIKFSVEDHYAHIHEEYDCEIAQTGCGRIDRKVYSLIAVSGKAISFDDCQEEPYEQRSGFGGMLPTDILAYFDKTRPVFAPAFLTDAFEFLKENDYYAITVYFGNCSFSIDPKKDGIQQISSDAQRRRINIRFLNINDIHIAALRKAGEKDTESLDIYAKNRTMSYIRTITRTGAERQFGQSADNISLMKFSSFAHSHFAAPTNDAFEYHVYFVGDPMYTRPNESVRMFND